MPSRHTSLVPHLLRLAPEMSGWLPAWLKLFDATWERIPPANRQTITRHWRRRGQDSPRVEVVTFLDCPVRDGVAVAETVDGGHGLRFVGPILECLPRRLACGVVGHELAHVLQHAMGGLRSEYDANETAAWWGFAVEEVHEWIIAAGLV